MQKILQFIVGYFIFTIALFTFQYSNTKTDQKTLTTVEHQLSGVNYLQKLDQLSILLIQYMENTIDDSSKQDRLHLRTDIENSINNIYQLQILNPEYISSDFNTQLEKIKTFNMNTKEYYKFLDTLNRKNYIIGEKSELLFESNKELYFLSALSTHYMPEFLISIFLSHNIIEKFAQYEISNQDKKIFIEQTKLSYLSTIEIKDIVNLLSKSDDVLELTTYLNDIQKELDIIKTLLPILYTWENNPEIVTLYLDTTHRLIEHSQKLGNKQFTMTKNRLQKTAEALKEDIFFNRTLFLLILLVSSILTYLFYRSYTSNIVKDLEIKKMHEALDEFVVYTKTKVDGTITYASSALEKLTGYTHKELIGNSHKLFKSAQTEDSTYKELWRTILSKKIYTAVLLNKTKDGRLYWAQTVIVPDLDDRKNLLGFSSYIIDVTNEHTLLEKSHELENANQKLARLAVIDTLTQVYNRLKLDSLLQEHFESYQRYQKIFSIILIDIDYFKSINDNYGHLMGDQILKKIVEIITKNVRSVDVVGRWGGEEFMVLCEETKLNSAFIVAEKIRKAVESYTFNDVDKLTISLGIAQIEEGSSINELIKNADDALYTAKSKGRNLSIKSDILV